MAKEAGGVGREGGCSASRRNRASTRDAGTPGSGESVRDMECLFRWFDSGSRVLSAEIIEADVELASRSTMSIAFSLIKPAYEPL